MTNGKLTERLRGELPSYADTQRMCREAADTITALVEAGNALVAKLDECEPHIANAFAMETIRGRPYSGPQYGEALEALRAALNQGDTA